MQIATPHATFRLSCQPARLVLVIAWLSGLLLGIYISLAAPSTLLSLMRTAVTVRVSIIASFAAVSLPLFISAAAVYFRFSFLLIPIAFLKGYASAFITGLLLSSYGNASWLVCSVFLLSDRIMAVPLMFFWLRHAHGGIQSFKKDLVICTAFALLLTIMDRYCTAPYIFSLLGS